MHPVLLPPLFGLVLTGGKSTRMGLPKSEIDYHGKPQEMWMKSLLGSLCQKVFLGAKETAALEEDRLSDDPFLGDIGPVAGVLTAGKAYPEVAWLVIGCDYPYLCEKSLQQLIRYRSPEWDAVAFVDPKTHDPEPILAIYEPAAIRELSQQVAQGNHSLRRLLKNTNTYPVIPDDPQWIISVDTPEQRIRAVATFAARGNKPDDCH